MRNIQTISTNILSGITLIVVIGLMSTLGGLAQQQTSRPERGVEGKGTQVQSEIDSISLQNGNVSLNIPLASLPPIAGGKLSASISAYYNSKLYDARSLQKEGYAEMGCKPLYTTSEAWPNETGGGWRITGRYEFFFRDAHDEFDYQPATSPECFGYDFYYMQGRFFKPMLRSPDGSEHELRIFGYYPTYNGYNQAFLTNYYKDAGTTYTPVFSAPTEMYTVDGTFIKVVVNPPSNPVLWTAYMKDGTQIVTQAGEQRIKDTNGNSILHGASYSTPPAYQFIRDEQTGREIRYLNTTVNGQSATQVQYQKVGGLWENVNVIWGQTNVQGKLYKAQEWNIIYNNGTCEVDKGLSWGFQVVREIVLPATEIGTPQRKYVFSYNSDTSSQLTSYPQWGCSQTFPAWTRNVSYGLGELSQIITPTGAIYKYYYTHDGVNDFGGLDDGAPIISRNAVTRKEVIHDGTTDTWTYSVDTGPFATGGSVVNPDGSSYSESFYPVGQGTPNYGDTAGLGGMTYRTKQSDKIITEKHWTLLGGPLIAYGSNVQRVSFNPVVDTEYTSLLDDAGNRIKMSAKKFLYDYNGELLQTIEYDWFDPNTVVFGGTPPYNTLSLPTGVPASAPVLRVTNNSYYNQAPDTYSTNAYHRRAVGASTVLLGMLKDTNTGNSYTQIAYDGFSYGTSPIKGNPTTISVWDDLNNQWISSNSAYDSYGNVISKTDPKGNLTQIFYEDATHALPTRVVTDPQNGTGQQVATTTYDFYTGLTLSSTDINGNTSSVDYTNHLLGVVDPLGRPGTTYSPYANIDGSNKRITTKIYYEDGAGRVRTESDIFNEGDALAKARVTTDQMGRSILVEKNENGASTYSVSSQTIYKTQDRVILTSNPKRSTADSADGWSRVTNDKLGRTIEAASFTGASQPPVTGTNTNWTGSVTTEYTANFTTVTDQAGKKRRSVFDASGQLVRVDEPDLNGYLGTNDAPIQPTYYKYNAIGKMTEVTQGVQKRYFLYDSIGRLLRVRQPEQQINPALNFSNPETTNTQWTAGFTYDATGSVLAATDAKNLTISYTYDALGRVQTKSYSDGVTPSITYAYDDVNIQNSKGKLTKVSSSVSETRYTGFDSMGRLLSSEQTTDGQTYPSIYKYNLGGVLVEQTYPSGRVVNQLLANDGRLSGVNGTTLNGLPKTYASNISYTATGVIKQLQLGNGLWESAKLNSREQVTELNMGVSPTDGSKWKLTYDYGEFDSSGNVDATKNSGNIARQTISFSGLAQPFIQTYKYDSTDRIIEAKEINNGNQTWMQTWGYDRYGNRTAFAQNVGGQQLQINNQTLPQVDPNTNRFLPGQGYSYDAAGNLTQNAEGWQFIFDGENKQSEVRNASNVLVGRYYYDGNGKRIKKAEYDQQNGTIKEIVIFVYDGMDKLIAEYSTVPSGSNSTVRYTATDPQGSPRVLTNELGEIVSRRDFMPFGEQLMPDSTYRTAALKYNTYDNFRQKFTGYQRDDETGLDFAEARYYNGKHGRFTAVDPLLASGKNANPQTFNRYVYTMNRPLILTDVTGLQAATDPNKPKETAIQAWTFRADGDNKVPYSKGATDLRKEDFKTLGVKDTFTLSVVNENVDVTFKEGASPSDYSSERAVILNTEFNGGSSTETRNGKTENPKESQVAVDGQTKTISDNPGIKAQVTERGISKQPAAGGSQTMYFVQGERNKKTGKLDGNLFYFKLEIKYGPRAEITTGSRYSRLSRDEFIQATGRKNPEELLKPSKKNEEKKEEE